MQGGPTMRLTVGQGSVVNRSVRTKPAGFQRTRAETYVVQSASEKGAAGDGVVPEANLSTTAPAWSILFSNLIAITVKA